MLAIPPPTTARTTDPELQVIRLDAEALEYAAHLRHVPDLLSASDADLVESIAWAHHAADALPGGLSGAVAAHYQDAPGPSCNRWLIALRVSARMHHAEQRWPELTTGLVPRHVADRMAEALLAETAGPGEDGDDA